MKVPIRLFLVTAAMLLISTPAAGKDHATVMYEQTLANADPSVCAKNSAGTLQLIKTMYVGTGAADEVLKKADPDGFGRQKALRDQLHRLDVPGYCECRYDRLKNEISPSDFMANFMAKDKSIGLKCVEKNLR